ncbi:MAG: hypothetical protein AAFP17_09730 [Pseudomonadota bacterium]
MTRFLTNDDGAVTIDWVALAAGVMMVSVGTIGLIVDEVEFVVDEIEEELLASLDVETPTGRSTGGGGEEDAGDDADTVDDSDSGDDSTTTVDAPLDDEPSDDTSTEACNSGGTCYIDDDGDGVSDRRRDGNGSIHNDGGVILANVN